MSPDAYMGSYTPTTTTNTTLYNEDLKMQVLNVKNGETWSTDTQIRVQVSGGTGLIRKSVYLNNQYLGEMNLISQGGDKRIFGFLVPITSLQPQNEIRIHIQDNSLDIIEDAITVYKY